MNGNAWIKIIDVLCDKEEEECEFGIGMRVVNSQVLPKMNSLYIHTGTITSSKVASSINNGLYALAEVMQNSDAKSSSMEVGFDDGLEPEVFQLQKVYIKNTDALIGWNYCDDTIIVPWENIKSIQQSR